MHSLTGQILISMPQLQDPFFARSIVYLCAHSDKDGAVGLIVNKLIESFTIDDLLAQLKIEPFKQSDGCEPYILVVQSPLAMPLSCTALIIRLKRRFEPMINSL